jgi:hypothetical protein
MTIPTAKALPLRGVLGGVDCTPVSSADARFVRAPASNLLPAGKEA